MKEIESVAIIGLGAVGINFAHCLRKHLPKEQVRIVADQERIHRYQSEGVYYNDMRCDFAYVSDHQKMEAADLVIFATKAYALEDAILSMSSQIGNDTLIMSAINGITSETILAEHVPAENILYTIAQGMDATKTNNRVICHHMGQLCFGAVSDAQIPKVMRVARFFDRCGFPYTIKKDILHHQWGKFMLNVGLNQVVALHRGTYASIQQEGEAREMMISAMREVVELSAYEGIHLREEELEEWLASCDHLDENGMPSMAQDVLAKRQTEVELFAGEVCKRAKHYGMACPINEALYRDLKEIEAQAG